MRLPFHIPFFLRSTSGAIRAAQTVVGVGVVSDDWFKAEYSSTKGLYYSSDDSHALRRFQGSHVVLYFSSKPCTYDNVQPYASTAANCTTWSNNALSSPAAFLVTLSLK
jgi:hypothetical protein